MTENDDGYEVGYGSPPKHSQFPKGQSGNPYGRPRGSKNRKAILTEILAETAVYRDGDKRATATKLELLLRAIRQHAATGNIAALDLYEKLIGHIDSVSQPGPRAILIVGEKLTEEEWVAKFGRVDG